MDEKYQSLLNKASVSSLGNLEINFLFFLMYIILYSRRTTAETIIK